MKFIKLNRMWGCTENKNNTTTEFYINTKYIRGFNYDEESDRTRLIAYNNIEIWIKETPEEILKLIEEGNKNE